MLVAGRQAEHRDMISVIYDVRERSIWISAPRWTTLRCPASASCPVNWFSSWFSFFFFKSGCDAVKCDRWAGSVITLAPDWGQCDPSWDFLWIILLLWGSAPSRPTVSPVMCDPGQKQYCIPCGYAHRLQRWLPSNVDPWHCSKCWFAIRVCQRLYRGLKNKIQPLTDAIWMLSDKNMRTRTPFISIPSGWRSAHCIIVIPTMERMSL